MNALFVILFSILSFNGVISVDFTDCGTKDASVSSLTVTDCSSSDDTCILKSGTTAGINVQFAPNVDSSTATVKLSGIINGAEIPWEVNPSDACKWGLNCPVKSGSSQELILSVAVSPSYPKIEVTVKIGVTDAGGTYFFCKTFPAQIQ